jgi:hypothetical protein
MTRERNLDGVPVLQTDSISAVLPDEGGMILVRYPENLRSLVGLAHRSVISVTSRIDAYQSLKLGLDSFLGLLHVFLATDNLYGW